MARLLAKALALQLARAVLAIALLALSTLGQRIAGMPLASDRGPVVQYFGRLWWSVDVALNVLALGAVETMSSRMGKAITTGSPGHIPCFLCGVLDLRWKNHCINNRMEALL
jgi:hypothetical protein